MRKVLNQAASTRAFVLPDAVKLSGKKCVVKDPVVFIGGCGRSGTTLLRVMLNAHSGLYAGPEFNVHVNLLDRLHDKFRWLPKKAYLLYDQRIVETVADKFSLSTDLVKQFRKESSCLPTFMHRVLSAAAGDALWVEKTPKNATILPYLFSHFPNMKFIHVIRDGRDVACSLRNHPRYMYEDGKKIETNINKPISKCISRWVHDVRAARKWKDDARYMEIRYRDLVEKPEEVLGRVCDFLGIPFEEGMLSYYEEKQDASHFLPSKNATKPLTKAPIGRWKEDLSLEERKVVERMGGCAVARAWLCRG